MLQLVRQRSTARALRAGVPTGAPRAEVTRKKSLCLDLPGAGCEMALDQRKRRSRAISLCAKVTPSVRVKRQCLTNSLAPTADSRALASTHVH